jgi:hypothetical protein
VPTKRRRRWQSRWEARSREHREAWKESGLTRVAYAEKAGLTASTFSRWLRNLKGREEEDSDGVRGERRTARPVKAPKADTTEGVRPARAHLVAVEVATPMVEEDDFSGGEGAKAAGPVEIALPSGIRIRYPGGVKYEELSRLVGLLEREC